MFHQISQRSQSLICFLYFMFSFVPGTFHEQTWYWEQSFERERERGKESAKNNLWSTRFSVRKVIKFDQPSNITKIRERGRERERESAWTPDDSSWIANKMREREREREREKYLWFVFWLELKPFDDHDDYNLASCQPPVCPPVDFTQSYSKDFQSQI